MFSYIPETRFQNSERKSSINHGIYTCDGIRHCKGPDLLCDILRDISDGTTLRVAGYTSGVAKRFNRFFSCTACSFSSGNCRPQSF